MKALLIFFAGLWIVTGSAQARDWDFEALMEKAEDGNVAAMVDLGKAYFYGKGTLKDPFQAKCWIKRAHDMGSREAAKIWENLELWQYSGDCGSSFDGDMRPKNARGDVMTDSMTGMVLVYMPGGCFQMGCRPGKQDCRTDEIPVHKVCLDGFWMGKTEVTQRQWQRLMDDNPSRFSADPEHPVESVSFDEVQEFIRRLNQESGRRFSLPTEAQWEYACRRGKERYPGYDEKEEMRPLANCGTCDSGAFRGRTAPVASFPPNDLGLYDMDGNVKEWCLDTYDKRSYERHRETNPIYLKKEARRVVRGGSFVDSAARLGCSVRDKSIPAAKSEYIGFRLVMLPE